MDTIQYKILKLSLNTRAENQFGNFLNLKLGNDLCMARYLVDKPMVVNESADNFVNSYFFIQSVITLS